MPGSGARRGRFVRRSRPDEERPESSTQRKLDGLASELDLAASGSDQTSSDSDQTASDSDQTSSDSDQTASDEDQSASDQESSEGADQHIRDLASVHREQASHLRDAISKTRLRTGVSRAINADKRDQGASERDRTAGLRDTEAQGLDEAAESGADVEANLDYAAGSEPGTLLERDQQASRAAQDRVQAAVDRERAAADRARAAEERTRSARDRTLAARDRAQAALDLEASETDDLTHVRRRGAGMKQMEREIDRARRTAEALVVAFVDVDGLKRVNDHEGHLAGDALLVAVADSLRACLRSYDLVMRFGGDEFVCALPNADLARVRERFDEVSSTLSTGPIRGSITVGFAELTEEDSAEELVRRADADLMTRRERA
jgi:diguanylate cyclase (GGDEF)-like protein